MDALVNALADDAGVSDGPPTLADAPVDAVDELLGVTQADTDSIDVAVTQLVTLADDVATLELLPTRDMLVAADAVAEPLIAALLDAEPVTVVERNDVRVGRGDVDALGESEGVALGERETLGDGDAEAVVDDVCVDDNVRTELRELLEVPL